MKKFIIALFLIIANIANAQESGLNIVRSSSYKYSFAKKTYVAYKDTEYIDFHIFLHGNTLIIENEANTTIILTEYLEKNSYKDKTECLLFRGRDNDSEELIVNICVSEKEKKGAITIIYSEKYYITYYTD